MKKLLPILFFVACIKPYNPNLHNPPTGYLVVEGNINSGPIATVIHLSRTEPLTDTATEIYESGATVNIDCSDGTVYTSSPGGNGQYGFPILTLDTAKTYRLDIRTSDGNQFQSDYVPVIPNPPIDSINGILGTDGMNIYVNTHNPQNTTRYYQWSYSETWEYHSAQASSLMYDPSDSSVVPRPDSLQIFTCWNTDSSTGLFLFSTAKLSSDVVYEFPLINIPQGTQKLSVEYSVAVSQYGLSVGAYNYLSLMQSNTENLGSIFDPLPSNLKGNIHCITQPSQTVVGYANASSTQYQRVFIQEPNYWDYSYSCAAADTAFTPNKVLNNWVFTGVEPNPVPIGPGGFPYPQPQGIYIPVDTAAPAPGWLSNLNVCIDCRIQGGTTTKPTFWQ